MHNKLKKWLNDQFWGVSTKYLQQYLNWFRMKEALKLKAQPLREIANKTILDTEARVKYFKIEENYNLLISSQN
jgi:hypothetical protein